MESANWITFGIICAVFLIFALVYICICCFKKGQNDTTNSYKQQLLPTVSPRETFQSYLPVKQYGDTLDLHGFSKQDALAGVKYFLDEKEREYVESGFRRHRGFCYIITGRGRHSSKKQPVLKPAVEDHLRSNDYYFEWDNPGMVKVHLQSVRSQY